MRIRTHKKRELILSGILCVFFYSLGFLLINMYLNTLDDISHPPVTYARDQEVKGVDKTVKSPESIINPTGSAQPLPTSASNEEAQQQDSSDNNPTVNMPQPSQGAVHNTDVTSTPEPANDAQSFLDALNLYRQSKGIGSLQFDANLQTFAQSRAQHFSSTGSMDNHAGFQDMMNNDGFSKMGFNALGENSSFGAFGNAQNLIEVIYGGHAPHDENQLKEEWTHVGIGVSGEATNFVFGGNKH